MIANSDAPTSAPATNPRFAFTQSNVNRIGPRRFVESVVGWRGAGMGSNLPLGIHLHFGYLRFQLGNLFGTESQAGNPQYWQIR